MLKHDWRDKIFEDIIRLDEVSFLRKLLLRRVTISAFATADHKKLATCNKLNGAEEAQEHFGESREKELLRADRPDS